MDRELFSAKLAIIEYLSLNGEEEKNHPKIHKMIKEMRSYVDTLDRQNATLKANKCTCFGEGDCLVCTYRR